MRRSRTKESNRIWSFEGQHGYAKRAAPGECMPNERVIPTPRSPSNDPAHWRKHANEARVAVEARKGLQGMTTLVLILALMLTLGITFITGILASNMGLTLRAFC